MVIPSSGNMAGALTFGALRHDSLSNMKPALDELEDLNDYSKRYHHNTNLGLLMWKRLTTVSYEHLCRERSTSCPPLL